MCVCTIECLSRLMHMMKKGILTLIQYACVWTDWSWLNRQRERNSGFIHRDVLNVTKTKEEKWKWQPKIIKSVVCVWVYAHLYVYNSEAAAHITRKVFHRIARIVPCSFHSFSEFWSSWFCSAHWKPKQNEWTAHSITRTKLVLTSLISYSTCKAFETIESDGNFTISSRLLTMRKATKTDLVCVSLWAFEFIDWFNRYMVRGTSSIMVVVVVFFLLLSKFPKNLLSKIEFETTYKHACSGSYLVCTA